MAGKILLEVVTPEKLLLSQEVDEVIAPGSEGEFGVLPGHCHLLSSLRIGELRYKSQEVWHYMSILWGYAEVTPAIVDTYVYFLRRKLGPGAGWEERDLDRVQRARTCFCLCVQTV